MGFFDSIKQFLGIGGIKVELQVPPQAHKAAGDAMDAAVAAVNADQQLAKVPEGLAEE